MALNHSMARGWNRKHPRSPISPAGNKENLQAGDAGAFKCSIKNPGWAALVPGCGLPPVKVPRVWRLQWPACHLNDTCRSAATLDSAPATNLPCTIVPGATPAHQPPHPMCAGALPATADARHPALRLPALHA